MKWGLTHKGSSNKSLKIIEFVLKITQRLLSDLPRRGPNTEEPMHQGLAYRLYSNALSHREFHIPASICGHFYRIARSISHQVRKSF